MGYALRAIRSGVGLASLAVLVIGAGAAAQTGTLETVAFEDVSTAPPCCAVPLDVVARAVKEALPGVALPYLFPGLARLRGG